MGTLKRNLTIAGVLIAGLVFLGYKKYDQASQVIEALEINIKKISNVRFNLPIITFDAIFSLTNPTNIDFGATLTSKIIIKQIKAYVDGVFIGKADAGISQIDLPANSTIDLPQMAFEVDSSKALSEFFNNVNLYLNKDFSKLNYKIDVEIFGNVVTLDA